jgi:hypothetical protein
MSKSEYVCQRCGLPIGLWRGTVWKHHAGKGQKSCGKAPIVVTRKVYEADIDALTTAARAALNRM